MWGRDKKNLLTQHTCGEGKIIEIQPQIMYRYMGNKEIQK